MTLYFWNIHNGKPESKVHLVPIAPTWVLSAPGGPHVGPMNLALREVTLYNSAIGQDVQYVL